MGDCKFLRQKKQVKINGEWVDTRSYRYLPYCVDVTPSVIVKGGNPNGKVYVGFGKKDGPGYGYIKTISLDASGNGRINFESGDIISDVDTNDNPSSCIVEFFGCNISTLGFGEEGEKHADKMSISCSRYVRLNELFYLMDFLGKTIKFNGFDTSKVTDTSEMFRKCHNLTSLDLSCWDVSNVTDMHYMFYECSGLTSLDLGGWDVSNVIDMGGMFIGCSSLMSINLSSFVTSSVINMSGMFKECEKLTSLDLSGWNVSNVTNMGGMFWKCHNITSLDLSGWDVSNVTNMGSMFWECSSLISLKVPNFDDLLEINMFGMFYGCSSLASLDLSGWRTAHITNMENMFDGCTNLTSLNLSGWDISHVRIYGMFAGRSSLTTIYMRNCDGFDVAYVQEELKRCGIPLDQVTIITK